MVSLRPVWSDKKQLESSLYGIWSLMICTNSTFLWQGKRRVVAIANRSDVDQSSAGSTRWLEHCKPGSQGPLSLQPWCWYLLGVRIWFLTWQSRLPTMDKFSSCLSSKLTGTVYIYILARWRGHFVHSTCVHIDFWHWFFRHDRKELVRHFEKAVYICVILLTEVDFVFIKVLYIFFVISVSIGKAVWVLHFPISYTWNLNEMPFVKLRWLLWSNYFYFWNRAWLMFFFF